jgi:hypothetical protein
MCSLGWSNTNVLKFWKMEITSLRNQMIQNAMAYNKYLTKGYLLSLELKTMAYFTHPVVREGYLKIIEHNT